MAVIFGVLLLMLSAAVILMEFNLADLGNLFPVKAAESENFVQITAAFVFIQFGELIAVMTVIPEVETRKKMVRTTLIGILIGNILVVLFVIADIAVLGASAQLQYSALYRVMRIINFGELINKVEVFLVAGYFFATIFRGMIHFYAACKTIGYALGIKTYQSLTVPIGTLMIGFTEFFASTSNILVEYMIWIYPYLAAIPQILLPLIALIVLEIKKRKEKRYVGCVFRNA